MPLDALPDTDIRIPVGPNRGLRWRRSAGIHRCWLGTYEWTKARRVASYAERLNPELVFDIGANTGYYTLLFARRGARVVAAEPLPENIAALQAHLTVNADLGDRVIVEELAIVGDDRGWAPFVASESTFMGRVNEGGFPVRARTLDHLVQEHGVPAIVKMDIEGGEGAALDGASELLKEDGLRILLVATHSDELTVSVQGRLKASGFVVEDVDGGSVAPTSRELVARRA